MDMSCKKLIVWPGIILLAVLIVLSGCRGKENTATGNRLFRSEEFYLSVQLPQGWAGAEGPEDLAKPFEGQVAFNSWGEADFWAREVHSGDSSVYSRETVMSQIPDAGAYIALVQVINFNPPGLDSPEEYILNDLSGLIQPHDWRQDASSVAQFMDFYKWGRYLRLEVGCNAEASDATVAGLNDLLQSWEFDAIPAGDAGWAFTVARQLLPEQVEPNKFSSQSALYNDQITARKTQVEIRQDKTVHFRFTYYWGSPIPQDWGTIESPSYTYHWWEIDVFPSGQAVLLEQGGVPLPTTG
jgi:hypothetical protein